MLSYNSPLPQPKYLKDVKDGFSDRVKLRDELRSLICLLEMLKDHVEDMEDDSEATNVSALSHLSGKEGPLFRFQHLLEEMVEKLTP